MISSDEMSTVEVLERTEKFAAERNIKDIVVASTTGSTGVKAAKIFDEDRYNLIVVGHSTGFSETNEQEITEKNRMKIEEDGGTRIRLATIFTDAPMQPDSPHKKSECGDCEICVKACPVNAIKGNIWRYGKSRHHLLDPHKCEAHLKKNEKEVGQPVCGICFAVCPYG